MFLCVKCILVNKIAANLKCSVYNFSLITPYQLFFLVFFCEKCSPADLKRRREILGANGLFDNCSGSCLRVIPNVFATGTPGWPSSSAVLCAQSREGETSASFVWKGSAGFQSEPALCLSSVTAE